VLQEFRLPLAVTDPRLLVRAHASHRITACLDVAAAAVLIVGTLPILCISALIIAWRSGRSPFVAHLRVGQFGQPLWMVKLRSMWNADAPMRGPWLVEQVGAGAPESKEVGDPRVRSRFARWCRRYSIDELPQLLHVLRGEMSMVGPRPITKTELLRHYVEDADEVLALRPGITGLWQTMGRNRLTYRQRRRLDLFLVRHYSPRLYLLVLWRTIPRALSGHGAW
jgi:exopolysaccharide production protein ExoY